DGDDIVLLGSNWGGPKHPAWSYNLLANPRAKVRVKGKTYSVTARLVTGAEREAMWQLALQVWPAYATYAKRAPHREIRVFHLTKD
ncbi:MAG TPA: nitroreductase family deazaflavin-dependent oxidoreductase, partial [Micromonosporaceae bacterium]|nr:nitroreductase family deazaflavin-dependent oxidoreductase [Micromonosporaceae bacterium]